MLWPRLHHSFWHKSKHKEVGNQSQAFRVTSVHCMATKQSPNIGTKQCWQSVWVGVYATFHIIPVISWWEETKNVLYTLYPCGKQTCIVCVNSQPGYPYCPTSFRCHPMNHKNTSHWFINLQLLHELFFSPCMHTSLCIIKQYAGRPRHVKTAKTIKTGWCFML